MPQGLPRGNRIRGGFMDMARFRIAIPVVLLSLFLSGLSACRGTALPEAPRIGIEGEATVYVEAERGSFEVTVCSNRDWTVSIPADAGWLMAVPAKGSGSRKVAFDFGPNGDVEQEVVVRIATSTVYTDLRVVRGGAVASETLLYEGMGAPEVGENTPVSGFAAPHYAWTRQGAGAPAVGYVATSNVSVRTTMSSAGAYEGASGGNCLFFGSGSNVFTIKDIALGGACRGTLTFGCSKSVGSEPAVFVPGELPVMMSVDGGAETPLAYTRTATNGWGLATARTTFPAGASRLTLRFSTGVSSAIRIDDIRVTGIGGGTAVPVVTTGAVEKPASTSAGVSAAYYYGLSSPAVTAFGIQWRSAAQAEYPVANVVNSPVPANPKFSTMITGLTSGIKYLYRGYVTTSGGAAYYGEEVEYTPQADIPRVYSGTLATAVTQTGATVPGSTFDAASDAPSEVGVRCRVKGSAQEYVMTPAAAVASPFEVRLTGLQPDTDYEYQAYVRVGSQIYADESSGGGFTTAPGSARYVWTTDVGTENVAGSLSLEAFGAPAWETGGTGVENIVYGCGGDDVTVRASGASAGYEGASGGNHLFFGTLNGGIARFEVNNIHIGGLSGSAVLHFGAADGTAEFTPDNLRLYSSADGAAWSQRTYVFAKGSGMWGYCTADVPLSGSTLHLRWEAAKGSVCRIDDMALLCVRGQAVADAVDPRVTTLAVSDLDAASATLNGSYAGAGVAAETGFLYRKAADREYTRVATATAGSPFSLTVALTPQTEYFFRAYARSATGTVYGRQESLQTPVARSIVFESPVLNGKTFRVGRSTTDAEILLPYSHAAGGESYTVTVSVSGAAAGGMPAVAAVPVTLPTGAGQIAIPLPAWTPSTAGAVTFTLAGIAPLVVKTVSATVEPAEKEFFASWNFSAYPTDKTASASEKWSEIIRTTPVTTPPAIPEVIVGSLTPAGFLSGSSAPATGAWGAVNFSANTGANYLTGPVRYATFTVRATKTLTITGMSGNFRRSGTGPAVTSIQYALDGVDFRQLAFVDLDKSDAQPYNPFEIAAADMPAALRAVPAGTTVTFRIVPYGGTNGTAGSWYINSAASTGKNPDFTITGKIE